MRRILATGLVALATLLTTATPAAADPVSPTPPTNCAAYLVLAHAGQYGGCGTLGGSPWGGTSYRSTTVSVQTGAVRATLQCALGTPVEFDVVAPFTKSAYVQVGDSSYCWVTMRALFDDTTAVATNTWGLVFS